MAKKDKDIVWFGMKLTPEEKQKIELLAERKGISKKEAVMNAAKGAGNKDLPNGVRKMIKDLTNPELDWRELLATNIQSVVKNDFTFRYLVEDGLGLPENAFIVCTFWMINALYLIGEEKKSRKMFDNLISSANHLASFRHTFSHYHLMIHPIAFVADFAGAISENTKYQWYSKEVALTLGLPAPVRQILEEVLSN